MLVSQAEAAADTAASDGRASAAGEDAEPTIDKGDDTQSMPGVQTFVPCAKADCGQAPRQILLPQRALLIPAWAGRPLPAGFCKNTLRPSERPEYRYFRAGRKPMNINEYIEWLKHWRNPYLRCGTFELPRAGNGKSTLCDAFEFGKGLKQCRAGSVAVLGGLQNRSFRTGARQRRTETEQIHYNCCPVLVSADRPNKEFSDGLLQIGGWKLWIIPVINDIFALALLQ